MTVCIESHEWANGYHDKYPLGSVYHGEGWAKRVLIGLLGNKPAVLLSLEEGEGFALNGRIYPPGSTAWTSIGIAHAE